MLPAHKAFKTSGTYILSRVLDMNIPRGAKPALKLQSTEQSKQTIKWAGSRYFKVDSCRPTENGNGF